MIPYAICRGKLIFKSSEELDVRLLELSPDSCIFRLPKYYINIEEKIQKIEFVFYQRNDENIKIILDSNFKISKKSEEKFWIEWELFTENHEFRLASNQLSFEYLDYVDAKLNMDDLGLTNHMIKSYPADEKIWDSLREQYEKMAEIAFDGENAKNLEKVLNAEYANTSIAIDNQKSYEKYLKNPINEWKVAYWKDAFLMDHPFSKLKVGRLIVGNPYCPLQGPDINIMKEITSKAKTENIEITYVLAPVSALKVEETKDYLLELHAFLLNLEGMVIEVETGDIGIENWLKTMKMHCFIVKRSVLRDKSSSDPRTKYLAIDTDRENMDLYVPFRHMNTGTFCTMNAYIENGDRGLQIRKNKCERYCENYVFLYPEQLGIIGKYNSLFSADIDIFKNSDIVEKAVKNNRRIIFNF